MPFKSITLRRELFWWKYTYIWNFTKLVWSKTSILDLLTSYGLVSKGAFHQLQKLPTVTALVRSPVSREYSVLTVFNYLMDVRYVMKQLPTYQRNSLHMGACILGATWSAVARTLAFFIPLAMCTVFYSHLSFYQMPIFRWNV